MDEHLSHVEIQMIESRVSNLTPSYWRKTGDNRPYGRLYYVKHGAGFIRPFGREYRLVPGRLYLVPPRGDFAYGCDQDMQIWWMHFSARIYGAIDLFDYLPYAVERVPEDLAGLERRMQRLMAVAAGGGPADQLEGTGLLLQLVAPFFREPEGAGGRSLQEARRRLLPVLRHIDENLGRRITVAELARIASYERSHFSTVFAGAFGIPPLQYVIRRRIERVQMALQREETKLEALADAYGFLDAFHLSKAFKQRTGMSPRAYRKAKGAAPEP
jgi:AraC-like DNA-binding protein